MSQEKSTKTPSSDSQGEKDHAVKEVPLEAEGVHEQKETTELPSIPSDKDNVEALKKEMLYLRADVENYKKRMVREQDQAIKFANERFLGDLIGIVHLFDMALSHSVNLSGPNNSSEIGNFVSGIQMTYREFTQLLARFGVEFIGKVGEKFDPSIHEAVTQEESESHEEGTVLSVPQRGCRLHGRLLRPSRVVVARPKQKD